MRIGFTTEVAAEDLLTSHANPHPDMKPHFMIKPQTCFDDPCYDDPP